MLADETRIQISFSVRASAAGVFLLAAAAMIAGYLPHGAVVSGPLGTHYEPAGGHQFAAYLAVLLIPGVAVLHHPTKPRIKLWLAWAVPCIAALLALTSGAEPLWHAHAGSATPLWPAWLTYVSFTAIVCGVVIVVPALGLGHRRSNLPSARIHRD
jgi:hypothetical protein